MKCIAKARNKNAKGLTSLRKVARTRAARRDRISCILKSRRAGAETLCSEAIRRVPKTKTDIAANLVNT